MTCPDQQFQLLAEQARPYLGEKACERLFEAYVFARTAHQDQRRRSGEPYITHPISVAHILSELNLDEETLIAALLHDVLEDTPCSFEDLASKFSLPVAELVEGVSKLTQMIFPSQTHEQAENFYKMMLAVGQDLRVLFIKIADRLHNMRTIASLNDEKRHRKSLETLEIYAPLAQRLGMNNIQKELQNRAFEQLYPKRSATLAKALKIWQTERHDKNSFLLSEVQQALEKHRVELVKPPTWNDKNLYGIYLKMKAQRQRFRGLQEPLHVVLIVENYQDCYKTLGVLHQLYHPLISRFRDYLALPKANGYQALHTSLILKDQDIVKFQIFTPEMYLFSCQGVSAYWSPIYQKKHETCAQTASEKHLSDIHFLRKTAKSSLEFLEISKKDLHRGEIYVFDDNGALRTLPQDSTPVDLAYALSTEKAPFICEAFVNGLSVPFSARLQNGQTVTLQYDLATSHLDPSWLTFVVTGKARTYIRQKLREQQQQQAQNLGQRLLAKQIAQYNLELQHVQGIIDQTFLTTFGCSSIEELYSHIGLGKVLSNDVIKLFFERFSHRAQSLDIDVLTFDTQWQHDRVMQFAQCCLPVRGDPIIGLIHPGEGIAIHREDCAEIDTCAFRKEHFLPVDWELTQKSTFSTRVHLYCLNQVGVLAAVSTAISRHNSNILGLSNSMSHEPLLDYLEMTLEVIDLEHLEKIIESLQEIPFVRLVKRA